MLLLVLPLWWRLWLWLWLLWSLLEAGKCQTLYRRAAAKSSSALPRAARLQKAPVAAMLWRSPRSWWRGCSLLLMLAVLRLSLRLLLWFPLHLRSYK